MPILKCNVVSGSGTMRPIRNDYKPWNVFSTTSSFLHCIFFFFFPMPQMGLKQLGSLTTTSSPESGTCGHLKRTASLVQNCPRDASQPLHHIPLPRKLNNREVCPSVAPRTAHAAWAERKITNIHLPISSSKYSSCCVDTG